MVEVHELSLWRCQAVLRAGGVGRIAFSAPDGSHLVPVNYSVVDEAIIIRTASNSLLARHGGDRPVAFEVDHVDYIHQRACSVVARGEIAVVKDPGEMVQVHRLWEPQPWADGDRSLLLKLPWTELTGRQLGYGWDPLAQFPSHRTY